MIDFRNKFNTTNNLVFNGCADKIFFTSDTHFGHVNIMKFCKRPFGDIGEHDGTLIDNWNSVVPKDGLVFHLGDFGFCSYTYMIDILRQLNGTKVLIIGNHDWKNLIRHKDKIYGDTTLSKEFAYISQQLFINIDGYKIYLNHFPFLCMDGVYGKESKKIQLFGHVHSAPDSKGLDMPRLEMLFKNAQYDVGVDNNNYRPISFSQVLSKLSGVSQDSPKSED